MNRPYLTVVGPPGFVVMCRQMGITDRNIDRANRSFEARHVVAENGCWLWTGTINENGYGHLSVKGRVWKAHRWSYVRTYGPVPEGLELDHFACDTRRCVNPDHVRPVTRRENVLRGPTVSAANAAKVACPKGHPLTERGRARVCRTCERHRAWVVRMRARDISGAPRRPALEAGVAHLATLLGPRPKKEKPMKTVAPIKSEQCLVRLTPREAEELDHYAAKHGVTRAEYLRMALEHIVMAETAQEMAARRT